MSNTRLDLQTSYDFSGFFPTNRVKCSSATLFVIFYNAEIIT